MSHYYNTPDLAKFAEIGKRNPDLWKNFQRGTVLSLPMEHYLPEKNP